MPSHHNQQGYLLIDHTESPGLPENLGFDQRVFGPGKKYEADLYTCSHCQRQVVKNPLRVRARAYCPKCDHIICDQCETLRIAAGGACVPFKAKIDAEIDRVIKNELVI